MEGQPVFTTGCRDPHLGRDKQGEEDIVQRLWTQLSISALESNHHELMLVLGILFPSSNVIM